MDEEKIGNSHDVASAQCTQFALQSVLSLGLPKTIDVSDLSFGVLGEKMERRISIVIDQLRDKHGENLRYLIAIAVHESWFACCEGAWYTLLMMSLGGIEVNDIHKAQSTPEGYAAVEGYAGAMASLLGNQQECVELKKIREGTPYLERPADEDLFRCLAVHWLGKAANDLADRKISDAMDWVYEGLDALELANGLYMHNQGEVMANEITKKATSKRGRKAVIDRHSKPGGTYSKQNAIRAAWASGKYDTRDICAEQECASLEMSFATARKALRNTPKPASPYDA